MQAKHAILASSSCFKEDQIRLESMTFDRGSSLGDLVLEYAQAENVSQIIIGARAQCPTTTLLDGSLALYLCQHAICPVVVARRSTFIKSPNRLNNGLDEGAVAAARRDSWVEECASPSHDVRRASWTIETTPARRTSWFDLSVTAAVEDRRRASWVVGLR
jgi:hypothetical protein